MKIKFRPKFNGFGDYVFVSVIAGFLLVGLVGIPISDLMAKTNASKQLRQCNLQSAVTASQVTEVLSACPYKLQDKELKVLESYEANAAIQERTIDLISTQLKNQVSRDIRPFWVYVAIAFSPAFLLLLVAIADGNVSLFENERESLERILSKEASEN